MKILHGLTRTATALGLLTFALLAPAAEDDREVAPAIDGAWRWDFQMPDGTSVRPRLSLATEEGKLTGTTSFRPGSEVPITNAVLAGDQLRFQVIRQRAGRSIVTTYTGTWSGKTINGKIESNWAGENQAFDWQAERTHFGVEGIWTWTNTLARSASARGGAGRGGRGPLEAPIRVALQQDGTNLTGRTVTRFGRPTPISSGSITNGEVYFEIERTYREVKTIVKYRGKQVGDSITGTAEMDISGRTRKG